MPLSEILKIRDHESSAEPTQRARAKGQFAEGEMTRVAPNPFGATAPPVASLEVNQKAKPVAKKAKQVTGPAIDILKRPVLSPGTSDPKTDKHAIPVLSERQPVKNGVVVFFSCKGGSGATTLAINAAHAYARQKYTACVVDLDLQLGDALAALALQSKVSMAQVLTNLQQGEGLKVRDLSRHESGITVLSQVGSLDNLDQINPESLSKLIGHLRTSFDVVAVDGVRDFSDNVLAVLDAADKIAIVTVQEILAIRRARWAFQIFRKIGFDAEDITLVVNRCALVSEIPLPTIRKMFEPAEVMPVPTDHKFVVDSLNRGIPLANIEPTHLVTRHIDHVAATLIGIRDPKTAPSLATRSSPLSRLMFWRKQ